MIQNWLGAVAALPQTKSEHAQFERTARRGWRVASVSFSLIYLVIFSLAIWDLIRAWQSARPEDWSGFWDHTRTVFGLSVALLLWIHNPITPLIRLGGRVIAAREAAIAGDDLRAPFSKQQPAAPQSYNLIAPVRFGQLRAPWQMQQTAAFVAAILLLFLGVPLVALGLVILLVPTSADVTVMRITGWLVVGMAAFLLACGALLLYRWFLLSRPFIVEADDWGLRWKHLARRRVSKSMAWHEARAFVLLRKRATADEYARESAFALVGRDATLIWLVKPEAEQGAHEELAGLIAARTKLSLRDITEYVEQDGDEDDSLPSNGEVPAALAGDKRPVVAPNAAPWSDGGTPGTSSERELILRGCLMILLPALIPFAPVALLAGAGWQLQQYQTNFYASLVRQVHAERPLFEDDLRVADGRWPVVSGDQFHQSWLYQDGAYHVRAENPMQTVAAPGPESYGDAAVEVTVAQRYRGNSGGVGLLLRSSEGNKDFAVFQVSPKGQWALLRYHDVGDPTRGWQAIWHGEGKAIHQGVGVQNRLLVIVQERRYLCYVNEQFLGVYEDTGPALANGRMGVFVNESPTEGIFSDFVVYPAPSTDIFAKD